VGGSMVAFGSTLTVNVAVSLRPALSATVCMM